MPLSLFKSSGQIDMFLFNVICHVSKDHMRKIHFMRYKNSVIYCDNLSPYYFKEIFSKIYRLS